MTQFEKVTERFCRQLSAYETRDILIRIDDAKRNGQTHVVLPTYTLNMWTELGEAGSITLRATLTPAPPLRSILLSDIERKLKDIKEVVG